MKLKEKLKNFKWGYPIIAFLLLLIGVFLIIFTETLAVVAITIGIILAVVAIVLGVLILANKERGVKFGFKIAFAVICLIAGIVTAVFYHATINIMISVFSLMLIIDASFKLHTTVMCKRYSLPLWWVLLTTAVLTIIGGYFFIRSNFNVTPGEDLDSSMKLMSIMLGICFIIDAVSNVLTPFFMAAYERAQKVDLLSELQREKMHELDTTVIPEKKTEGQVEEKPTEEKKPEGQVEEKPTEEKKPEGEAPEKIAPEPEKPADAPNENK